jgi:hypothetical protein
MARASLSPNRVAQKLCDHRQAVLALAKVIGGLGNGDTLVVCKLDRLARSSRDLLNTWPLSLRLALPLNRWVMLLGPTQPHRTVD